MMIKKTTLFTFIFLAGCGDQYSCGYDPSLFKLTDIFSIKIEDTKINPQILLDNLVDFGHENNFCIASNTKHNSESSIFINFQLIKDDFGFYIYGDNEIIFKQESKSKNKSPQELTDTKLFCDMISPLIDSNKKIYYTKGKLCENN